MTIYVYATLEEVYILDGKNHILDTLSLNEKEAQEIAAGNVLEKEKEVFKKYDEKIIYCNLRKDQEVLTDYTLLNKIVVLLNPPTKHLQSISIAKSLVQASVRFDTLLIQAIRSIEEMDKTINLLAKRLREWYEWYNPEFSRSIGTHEKFAELIQVQSKEDLLAEIGCKHTMGADLEQEDIDAMYVLARQITDVAKTRETTNKYIDKIMKKHMPNFAALAGTQVGAKLLSIAGSFRKLVRMPSSTLQVLGAEKALFRHLKTGAKPPKHGVLFQHAYVSKSREKGRASRMLANSLALTIRSDYFGGEPTLGKKLLAKLEAKR
ncbi:MAG: nucleolar protein 56 [Candidatus Woesearchaeota archaeon]|jgi:nucleolar protein 56